MIKKAVGALCAIVVCAASVFADSRSTESPFRAHGTAGCVVVSTSAWTAVPTTVLAGRTGLYVTAFSSNTANTAGNFDNDAATTVQVILLKPGITQYHQASDLEPLYLLSLHTQGETVCYGEMKQ